MATFKLVSANDKQVWSKEYNKEYVRESGLLDFMGPSSTDIIRVDKKLGSEKGSLIHFTYFRRLSGPGVRGSATLVGNEENMPNYACAVKIGHVRNGVSVPESESFRTEIDIMDVARDELKSWNAETLRDDLLDAGQSVVIKGGNDNDGNPLEDTYKTWANASAAEKNAWLTTNADRILCGNVKSNTSSNVMSTSLTNISATQKLSSTVLSVAKTMARTATSFRPRPYKSDATKGREWFVLFVDCNGYRDLFNDPLIQAANKDARVRGIEDNPLFQAGDLIWNGIIIREVPELKSAGLVGAGGINVGHALLCGQSAIVLGYGKMASLRVNELDYNHVYGVGTSEIRGQAKFSAAGYQTGIVSIFHPSVDNA